MSFISLLFLSKGEINQKQKQNKKNHPEYVRKPSYPQTALELSWKLIGLLTKMLKTTVG